MSDVSQLISGPCILMEDSKIVCVYLIAPEIPDSFVETVKKVEMGSNRRTDGLVTHSRIFGYRPREQIRMDFCSSTLLSAEMPKEHAEICDFAKFLSTYYSAYAPEEFAYHKTQSDKVLPQWRIQGTPFTSGIINRNNPLKYHVDAGNINKVYSNMVAFKQNCVGGYLAMPEYDLALQIEDRSLTFFDGQEIIHGVTPFTLGEHGYRYTLVYYSLQRMWQCQPIDEELARIKKRKTEREQKRYHRLKGDIPNEI